MFRRPSEPCINEEEEDEDLEDLDLRTRTNQRSMSSLEDEDGEEMIRFLKKVRSHSSFAFDLGDEDSPKVVSKNPLHRVATT